MVSRARPVQPSKAPYPMEVRPSGSVRRRRNRHAEKLRSPISRMTASGAVKVTASRPVQLEKAWEEMVMAPGAVMVTVVRRLAPAQHWGPKVTQLAPQVSVRRLLSRKAPAPMPTTGTERYRSGMTTSPPPPR